MIKPTADDVRKSNMFTLASAHAVYVEVTRKFGGEEGLVALGEANRVHGLELGRSAIEEGSLRKGDLESIHGFFVEGSPFFGFELQLLTSSDSELEIKVTYCPWVEGFKAKGAESDVCHWVCKMDEGIGQAVDPAISMTLPKCMMRGDPYCIYRFSK